MPYIYYNIRKSIVCYNNIDNHNTENVSKVLIQSLLQAYDYCRANYNMFDLKHLACTQVGYYFIRQFKFCIFLFQIILCHNHVYKYNDCAEILSHELIHAYDYCRANLDIENNYHVACTEVKKKKSLYIIYNQIFERRRLGFKPQMLFFRIEICLVNEF